MAEQLLVNGLDSDALSGNVGKAAATKPSGTDAALFADLMAKPSENTASNALTNFVQSAQNKLDAQGVRVDASLRQFDRKFSVINLVGAMHESSMKSVSIQLSGKVASKTSEGFEQLVKQQ